MNRNEFPMENEPPASNLRVYSPPAQTPPVDWLRRILPLRYLERAGDIKQVESAADADVVYLVSPTAPGASEMKERWSRAGKKLVVDYDDDHFAFDNYTSSKSADARRACVAEWLRVADAVTCTTSYLASVLAEHGAAGRVHVCPNALAPEWARASERRARSSVLQRAVRGRKRRAGRTLRIGWTGSPYHAQDLPPVLEALRKIVEKDPEIEIWSLGDVDFRLSEQWRGLGDIKYVRSDADAGIGEYVRYTRSPAVTYPGGYYSALELMDVDVAVCPLKDTAFNRGKSWVKLLDWGIKGVPTIASNTGPFAEMLNQDMDGVMFVGHDTDAWMNSIEDVLEDPERERHGKEACEWIKERGLVFPKAAEAWRGVLHKQKDPRLI